MLNETRADLKFVPIYLKHAAMFDRISNEDAGKVVHALLAVARGFPCDSMPEGYALAVYDMCAAELEIAADSAHATAERNRNTARKRATKSANGHQSSPFVTNGHQSSPSKLHGTNTTQHNTTHSQPNTTQPNSMKEANCNGSYADYSVLTREQVLDRLARRTV